MGAERYIPVINQFDVPGSVEGEVSSPGLGLAYPHQLWAVEHVVGGAADVDVYLQVSLVDEPGAVVTRRPGAAPAVPLAGLRDGVVICDES